MQLPFFYESNLTEQSNLFQLSSTSFKHAIQVLRLQKEDAIHITNGKGLLCRAIILNADKKQATVKVEAIKFIEKEVVKTCIGISLLKNNNRFEWFLEKATELGITEIYPLLCSRTEKQHFRLERLNAIIISAMLQSQQAWLPTLLQPLSFNNIVVDKKDYNIKLIAHCNLKEKVPLQKISIKENTMLLIGPEGDFTEDEIFLAEKNNFIAVSLGNNRFRTETAGIAAAVLLKLNN